jgi:hypothetical protein
MMKDCPFEADVLDALASHRWPARAEEQLLAHVQTCEGCRDLAAVASALMHDGDVAFSDAHVPAPASVWHRAQLRAREEAARVAMRPIGFVQGVAFSFGIAAMIALAVWGFPIVASLLPGYARIVAALPAPSLSMPGADFASSLLMNTALQAGAAACIVLASVTLYFTLRDTNP